MVHLGSLRSYSIVIALTTTLFGCGRSVPDDVPSSQPTADPIDIPIGYTVDDPPSGNVGAMTVLKTGEVLTANSEFGTVEVRAPSATKRQIRVLRHGESVRNFTLDLKPRDHAFRGMTGIYTGHNYGPGRSDIVAEEGCLFLKSDADLQRRLRIEPSMGYAKTSSGLLVGLFDPKYSDRVNIEIIQVYVSRQKPTNLPSSGSIKIEG